MKAIRLILLGLMALSISSLSFAQDGNRPKLFERFPDQISLNAMTLEQAMDAREGQDISIAFGGGLVFTGTVLSNEMKYGKLQTILIKSPDFANSILSLSKIIEADTPVRYSGRIINHAAADGYLIKKDASNQYQLAKITTESVLQDCSYQ